MVVYFFQVFWKSLRDGNRSLVFKLSSSWSKNLVDATILRPTRKISFYKGGKKYIIIVFASKATKATFYAIKTIAIMTNNSGHNILRLFDVLPNFLFTTSEGMHEY